MVGEASTDEGRAAVEAIAQRHDIPADAAIVLMAAIRRGNGRQAQFSHPALGGMGQWSRGGGTMIGDMFNAALKARVEQLCNDLADHVSKHGMASGGQGASDGEWWPRDLGRPSAVGSQNERAYACFPVARRLAIRDAEGVRVYDTADHHISGVSQQQSGTHDLSFTSQNGTVRVSDLAPVGTELRATSDDERARHVALPDEPKKSLKEPPSSAGTDVLGLIERLHELQRKGVITQEEYAAKKTELLTRL